VEFKEKVFQKNERLEINKKSIKYINSIPNYYKNKLLKNYIIKELKMEFWKWNLRDKVFQNFRRS
jgi:hypothetical protein